MDRVSALSASKAHGPNACHRQQGKEENQEKGMHCESKKAKT